MKFIIFKGGWFKLEDMAFANFVRSGSNSGGEGRSSFNSHFHRLCSGIFLIQIICRVF